MHRSVRRQVHDRTAAQLRCCQDRGVEGRDRDLRLRDEDPGGREALAHRRGDGSRVEPFVGPRRHHDGVLAIRVHQDERHPRPRVRGHQPGGVHPSRGEVCGNGAAVIIVAHPGDQGGARPEQARATAWLPPLPPEPTDASPPRTVVRRGA